MNWLLLKNSLVVGGGATLLALALGLIAAVWTAGLPGRLRRGFVGLAVIALALPPFVIANCWLDLLGNTGVWRSWLGFDILSLGGAVWLLALWLWPVGFLAISAAWRRLSPELLESDPAVHGWAMFRWLLLPAARAPLFQAGVVTFVLALNNFTIPAILQVKVFPAEVWVEFNTSFDSLAALRTGWPMLAIPIALLLWLRRQEFASPFAGQRVKGRAFRQQLGRPWFVASAALALALCVLSPGLPLFQLTSASRTWLELPGALAAGSSAVWNSLSLSVTAASLVIAAGVIRAAVRSPQATKTTRERPVSALLRSLLWMPFLVPGVLLGIALIKVFNRPGAAVLYQGPGIVILAFVIRYVAFGWNPLRQAAQSVNPDLVDAARLEGVSIAQRFRYVDWPHIAPRVSATWYIVFLLCLWDVESMILVVPPGGETLALRVFNLLHYGHNGQVNAICVALIGLALLPVLLYELWHLLRVVARSGRGLILPGVLALLLCSCSRSTPSLQSRIFSSVQIIASRGVGVGQVNKPRSVAVDKEDNLYVVDMTGRVQKFSPTGKFLLSWQMPQTDKGRPKGMCRDAEGNIIVNEPHYSRVNHFSTNGSLLLQWGQHGTNPGELTFPRAVAVNSHHELFLSEYGLTEWVQKFKMPDLRSPSQDPPKAPKFLLAFGHAGSGPGEFNRPEGLCMDAHDRLYVADSCNHRIQVFDSDGHFLRAYGKAGTSKGELSYPYDICVDRAGRQYVCEFGNSRIQVFDTNGCSIEMIGGPGAAPGQFANPWGVALDSHENLYVADSQNHRVQKLIRRSDLGFSRP